MCNEIYQEEPEKEEIDEEKERFERDAKDRAFMVTLCIFLFLSLGVCWLSDHTKVPTPKKEAQQQQIVIKNYVVVPEQKEFKNVSSN